MWGLYEYVEHDTLSLRSALQRTAKPYSLKVIVGLFGMLALFPAVASSKQRTNERASERTNEGGNKRGNERGNERETNRIRRPALPVGAMLHARSPWSTASPKYLSAGTGIEWKADAACRLPLAPRSLEDRTRERECVCVCT